MADLAVEKGPGQGAWARDGGVALVAAAVAGLDWVLLTQLLGVHLQVRAGGGTQSIGVISALVTTMVVAITGAALLGWLERRSARGLRTWTIVAVSIAVVSLLGPAGATSVAAGLGLVSLHVLVAGIVIVGLRRRHSISVGAVQS